MQSAKPFGRRVNLQQEASGLAASAASAAPHKRAERAEVTRAPAPPLPRGHQPAIPDDDIDEWKPNRKGIARSPWSGPLLLMASMCFGTASFVVPGELNDAVQYLLWALTAASLVVWYARRNESS